ncbi:PepSY domain-containing protein [Oleiagrimonas soli]|uniref:Lipoprotein n=1 Tax=Oleiagrimonas soli TaxID=1543381 RepID=A0A841KLB9_9GAMM|nr:PepSY domain-containing protein [Oleiagrimonas soli]MBB6182868.1 hypothetical protein [Oleiagrimonas soli]
MTRMSRSGLWLALLGTAMVAPGGCAMPSDHVALTALGSLDDQALAQRLGLGADGGLTPHSAPLPTAQGTTKQRMLQTYHGIPVQDRGVVIERDATGNIVSVRGDLARDLAAQLPQVDARIAPDQAVQALRAHDGIDADAALSNVQHALSIDPHGDAPKLVYQVSFYITQHDTPRRPTGVVDAMTGTVLKAWDGLTTQDGQQGSRPSGGFVGPAPTKPAGD